MVSATNLYTTYLIQIYTDSFIMLGQKYRLSSQKCGRSVLTRLTLGVLRAFVREWLAISHLPAPAEFNDNSRHATSIIRRSQSNCHKQSYSGICVSINKFCFFE